MCSPVKYLEFADERSRPFFDLVARVRLTGIAWPDADPAKTYLHDLEGPDPVFRWISGTGARPVPNALSDPVREEFEREYRGRLREAYPAQPYGSVLPFRRIFVVAHEEAQR